MQRQIAIVRNSNCAPLAVGYPSSHSLYATRCVIEIARPIITRRWMGANDNPFGYAPVTPGHRPKPKARSITPKGGRGEHIAPANIPRLCRSLYFRADDRCQRCGVGDTLSSFHKALHISLAPLPASSRPRGHDHCAMPRRNTTYTNHAGS